MKKAILIGVIAMSSSMASASITMSEELCKPQAQAVYTVLDMIKDGSLNASPAKFYQLDQVLRLIKQGEYCKARSIVLSVAEHISITEQPQQRHYQ